MHWSLISVNQILTIFAALIAAAHTVTLTCGTTHPESSADDIAFSLPWA